MNRKIIILASFAFITSAASAADPRDPRTRDEDISSTEVTVAYELRGDGLYEYVYTVASPENNLGQIQDIVIDLSCSSTVDGPTPPPSSGEGFLGDNSSDGAHVPVSISADYGQSGIYAIDMQNRAGWLLSMEPGSTITGLRLLSPAKPGLREYKIAPFMDNDPSWDYPEEPDPTIPWIDDFTVTGMIAGPGCPGVSPPVDEPVFEGSGNLQIEPEAINKLLVYKAPMKDKVSVSSDTESVTITIVYSDQIDPKTFKVQPGYLQPLFNPEAGTSQTVEVPLKAARNMIHFEVRPDSEHGPRKNDPDNPSYKDRDTFEFRKH